MEKPIECSHCTQAVKVIYKQLKGTTCQQEGLCENCPKLKSHLEKGQFQDVVSTNTKVVCQNCGTNLDEFLHHEPLGCKTCYEVFYDAICKQLNVEQLTCKMDLMIPKNDAPTSELLLKLSKDLQEAVNLENFEKAAILRDEINKLKQSSSEL